MVGISNSSPCWINYLDYLNRYLLNGLKATSLINLKNMFIQMNENSHPILSILIQLNDCQLTFEPPLIGQTSQLSLEEILHQWINSYLNRADFIPMLTHEETSRETFTSFLIEDPIIIDLKEKICEEIRQTSNESMKLFEVFSQYAFLYQLPVNQSFQLFLNGEKKSKATTPKNFLNEQDAGRRFVSFFSFSQITKKEENLSIDHFQCFDAL